MTPVLMFPGQSSLRADALARTSRSWPDVTHSVLTRAGEVLGRDLAPWCTEIAPRGNEDVQLAVFISSHVHLCALAREVDTDRPSLGLSLGEYNHLVHVGALAFDDAVALVSARGAAYDAGPDGTMAAVFPLPEDELRPLLPDGVEIVNYNSPSQHVIAGDAAAVQRAIATIEDETWARVVVIERRLPMHASRFAPVGAALRPALQRAPWRAPVRPYRPNLTADVVVDPRPRDFVDVLSRHVHEPVRWRASIDRVVADHDGVAFVEVGPGSVLTNLLRPSWRPEPRARTEDFARALEVLDVA